MATEKRLIDANELLLQNELALNRSPVFRSYAKVLIDKAPTVDAVEVVRCKDCKHWNNKGFGAGCGWCEAWDGGRLHDNYCNYGERRTNEQESHD